MVENKQWLIFNLKRNQKLNSSSFCNKTVILCHSHANKAYCCCCCCWGKKGGGGGGAVSKKFFCAPRRSVWSKNNGEARAPPLGPLLLFIVHVLTANWRMRTTWWHWIKGYSPLAFSMRGRHSTGCWRNDIKTGCPFPRDRKACMVCSTKRRSRLNGLSSCNFCFWHGVLRFS